MLIVLLKCLLEKEDRAKGYEEEPWLGISGFKWDFLHQILYFLGL